MTEKERRILEMQAPSTRRALERSPDLDLEWLRRPLPKEAQVVKEDGSVNLNLRPMFDENLELLPDVVAAEEARGNAGKRFEEVRTAYLKAALEAGKINARLADQIETNHVMPNPEKRERAIESFIKSRTIEAVKNAFKKLFEHATSAEQVIAQRMRDTVNRWKNEK